MQHEVVLVKGTDERIIDLVTISDVGEQFISLSEPFWILEQIENHIRSLLDAKLTVQQLAEAIDQGDKDRPVESAADLTFGEYLRILEKPDQFNLLNLAIDRGTLVKRLDQVRKIRNDVMHFHPDGISIGDLEILRETNKFFYLLSQFRPTLTAENKKQMPSK